MGVVARKLVDGSLVYWLSFTWQGKRVWEHAGKVARAAERLEAQRLREVALGTYQPPQMRTATTAGQWIGSWVEKRATRNADDETSNVRRYVLACKWFASMPLNELRPKHLLKLVDELKSTTSETTGQLLSPKTVANVYGTIRTSLRDARFAELLDVDPCVLPRGTFKRRARGALRTPYTAEEVTALISDEKIAPDFRVWNALAFFTGMREGEVCGRRFRDWNRNADPLGALTVDTQYKDQPLKTEDRKGDQPRKVPVHPELAIILERWFRDGWAVMHGRAPTPNDWIVPKRKGDGAIVEPHTKSTAYKSWRRSCRLAGVENRSLHSSRHTFVSLARRGGARKDVVEQITHNATGDIVDEYTTWDWAPLCEAVRCFPVTRALLADDKSAISLWRRRESNPGPKTLRNMLLRT